MHRAGILSGILGFRNVTIIAGNIFYEDFYINGSTRSLTSAFVMRFLESIKS